MLSTRCALLCNWDPDIFSHLSSKRVRKVENVNKLMDVAETIVNADKVWLSCIFQSPVGVIGLTNLSV